MKPVKFTTEEEARAWDRYAAAVALGHTADVAAQIADVLLGLRRERGKKK